MSKNNGRTKQARGGQQAPHNRTAGSKTRHGKSGGRQADGKKVRSKNGQFVEGRLQGNPRGFAFLLTETGDDIFVAANDLGGATHGDLVRVQIISSQKNNGEVVKILERGIDKIVGTLRREREYGIVTPDESRFFADIQIIEGLDKAKSGDKVLVALKSYGAAPQGKIIENLGQAGSLETGVLSIIRAHGLYEDFKKSVVREANECSQFVSEADCIRREDFRGELIITIDGADARDLDDAVTVKRVSGGFELAVHIADVAHYVRTETALDKEAARRGTSVYFPDLVLPMLPRALSNGICSLNAGEDRLTLSCVMTLDASAAVTAYRVVEGVIRVSRRMTYDDCNAIFGGDAELQRKYSDILPMLEEMRTLARILNNKREKRGSIDFDLTESKIIVEGGEVVSVGVYPRGESNRIIEEFMLCANECVAQYGELNRLPIVHRVHEEPSPEKLETLSGFLDGVGVRAARDIKPGVKPIVLQKMLKAVEGAEYYPVVSKVTLRSMQKARYAPESLGHFGLAAEFYCHFTSPIRRYPDLATHRVLKDFIQNGLSGMADYKEFVRETARTSSAAEREADATEREVDDFLKTEYMRRFIGQQFDGVISGVTGFGIFVELANTVEGLIRIENLPDDRYVYDERKFCLVGRTRNYRLGDRIEILVAGINEATNRVEFLPACDDIGGAKSKQK